MRQIRHSLKLALAAALLITPVATQAASRADILANSCAGCHGTDGKSAGTIPSISGLKADYFSTAMKGFRDGSRQGSVMGRIAKGYSDEEITLMAKHFSEIK